MTEEEKAALHRTQEASRRQARRDAYVGLAGNRDARIALEAAWQPPLLAALEAQGVGDDSEFLEGLYVEVPPQDIYISEITDDLLI
jgi:hypothetical protein